MGPLLKSTSPPPPPAEGFDEDGGISFVVLDPPSDTRDVGGGSIIVGGAEAELFGWFAAWVDVSIELSGPLTILITGFTLISG